MYMRKTAHEERRVWGGENLFIRFVMLGESWSLQGIVNDAISSKLRSTNFRKIPRISRLFFSENRATLSSPRSPRIIASLQVQPSRRVSPQSDNVFSIRPPLNFSWLLHLPLALFSISIFFLTYFPSYFMYKGKGTACTPKKKYFEERENYLRWIIFKDKKKEFSERFSRSGSLANTKKGEGRKHVAV